MALNFCNSVLCLKKLNEQGAFTPIIHVYDMATRTS